jgi:hypothetical protein
MDKSLGKTMNTNNPTVASAPVPPTGTEQAAPQQKKPKPAEETGDSGSDLVEAALDTVVEIVTGIFDN